MIEHPTPRDWYHNGRSPSTPDSPSEHFREYADSEDPPNDGRLWHPLYSQASVDRLLSEGRLAQKRARLWMTAAIVFAGLAFGFFLA